MKKILLLTLLFSQSLFAQLVTTNRAFPSGDSEITIIVDLKLAKDSRAKGLLGKTSDVYLWSGAGTSATGNAFEYGPSWQKTWNQPYEQAKMTSLGNDKWSITLNPRTYFGVPADKKIVKLGLLLKNGNGSAQTEDFFLTLYSDGTNFKIVSPDLSSYYNEGYTLKFIMVFTSDVKEVSTEGKGFFMNHLSSKPVNDTLSFDFYVKQKQTDFSLSITGNQVINQVVSVKIKPQISLQNPPVLLKNGITYESDSTAYLKLIAPQKEFVYVVSELNNWTENPDFLMNKSADGSYFWLKFSQLVKGKQYAYQYLLDGAIAIADPYAELVLDPDYDKFITSATYPNLKAYPVDNQYGGVVSILQTGQAAYDWKQTNFKKPAVKDLVIYELLIRDFSETRKFTDVQTKIPYLKELGINAIELMPVNEFTGNESWGYNPTFYTAPDKAYGTASDLKAMIDACHANGIAVILDVVFNHADKESPYVKAYWDAGTPAANSPFYNVSATHPFSVFFDANHESIYYQQFMDNVLRYWLTEYKIDGYRFDLSKGFTQVNSGSNVSLWGQYDASRIRLLKRMFAEVRKYSADSYLILEHFGDNSEEKELANYGFMFWGNANYDFRNAAKGFTSNMNWMNYKTRGWNEPRLINYMESHDEERMLYDVLQNGNSMIGYSSKDLNVALERLKAATALFFTFPGPKMLWQFGEFGYDVSIDFNGRVGNKPLKWNYLDDTARKKLHQVYAEMAKLKTTQKAFSEGVFTESTASMFKTTTILHTENDFYLIANFALEPFKQVLTFPKSGVWYDYFTGKTIEVTGGSKEIVLEAGEFHLFSTKKIERTTESPVQWDAEVSPVLANEQSLNEVLVFPNPTSSYLEINEPPTTEIEIYSSQGALIKSEKLNSNRRIQINNLASGIYFIKIKTTKGMVTKKFVKE